MRDTVLPRSDLQIGDPAMNKEAPGIAIGLTVIFVLGLMHFWGGKTLAVGYLVIVAAIAIVIVGFAPRGESRAARIASRFAAFGLTVIVVWLEAISGLPLLVAEALRPFGQALHNGNNFTVTVLAFWLGLVIILSAAAVVYALRMFWAKNLSPVIMLSGIVMGLALFPLVGMIAQEMVRNPPPA